MALTNERKRGFDKTLEEELTDDRPTKRARILEEDFTPNRNVLETASQPIAGFMPTKALDDASTVSSSAPPIFNGFSETMGPVDEQKLPLEGELLDSPLSHMAWVTVHNDSTRQTESQGLMAVSTQNATLSVLPSLSGEIALDDDPTDFQPKYSSPETPPASFFAAAAQADKVDEVSNPNILGHDTSIQEDSNALIQLDQPQVVEIDSILDAHHNSTPPVISSQTSSAARENSQFHVDSPYATPRPASQLPVQVTRPQEVATPPKSSLPPSSPLTTIASSPLTSPKSTPKDNPFGGLGNQETLVSVDDVPPTGTKHGDGQVQPAEAPAHSKKENIYAQHKVEGSDPGLKPHEASSNLSKSSPNHPSVSSQHRSAEKIRTPFRSPLFNKTLGGNQQQQRTGGGWGQHTHTPKSSLSSALQEKRGGIELKKRGALNRIKGTGTTAARAAFKSPLRAGANTDGGLRLTSKAFSSSLKAVSRNDSLQNRLQLLRRAVKIKESGEDEKLEALVGKWREVAKEVAWELWGLVKEGNVGEGIESRVNAGLGAGGFGPFGGNDRGWDDDGFGAAGDGASQQNRGRNTAQDDEDTEVACLDTRAGKGDEDAKEEEDDEPNVEERSMSTMLRQLGIAQETLGWDEEEGDFAEITT